MIGKKSGAPPKKGPHRDSTSKNTYPGNNGIQVKGFKFIGVR